MRVVRTALSLLALTALAAGPLVAQAQPAGAQTAAPAAGPTARGSQFAAAADEFGVPRALLEAVSYAQSRWEAHAGQPSTDGGYGPMNLLDGSRFAGSPAVERGAAGGPATVPSSVDRLGRAAALIGVDRSVLRTDPGANIRGGAALLASTQRRLGMAAGAGSDPSDWYAAVAAQNGSTDQSAAEDFADDTYAVLAAGAARTTADGQRLDLVPHPGADSAAATAGRAQLARVAGALGLRKPKPDPHVECPRTLACQWVPAPYQLLGDGSDPTNYGNHDLAHRAPAGRGASKGPTVDYIVIHDTEASWDTTLSLVQDPTYVSWHYSIRSSDGQVAQHVATKDVAWHAGNWYVNMHSIGIEHEGFAAQGATWYGEPLYRSSARLVRYLAGRYGVPLDRAHILGHDQVLGTTPALVAGMHWDPGPYWDWEHYFDLLGAPLRDGVVASAARAGDVVRIVPGFRRNTQVVTGCDGVAGSPCPTQGTNFVPLHVAPSAGAPLVSDVGLHPDGSASTSAVDDIGARATAGVEYVVAEHRGNWTAVWYLGQKGWFLDPPARPTAIRVRAATVMPRAGLASVPVYGRAYPEPAAYAPYPGILPQDVVPLQYAMPAGQRYVLSDARIVTDYYAARTYAGVPPDDHVDVRGADRYYQVSFGHRVAYVRAADVDVLRR